jgi:DNA-binding NtrC family response regulator
LSNKRLLVIDIDPVVRSAMRNYFAAHDFDVCVLESCHEALAAFRKFRPDIMVLDLYLPNGDAPHLLRQAKKMSPPVPVVVLSGQTSTDTAARAIRHGAEQILVKPVELPQLHSVLQRLVGDPSPRGNAAPKHKSECLDPFIGSSTAIQRLREAASRVLPSESPILIQGETGSGKGILANWIHRNGPRAHQPFLDLNCAGLSRDLLESELFGFEKGAFTSAVNSK